MKNISRIDPAQNFPQGQTLFFFDELLEHMKNHLPYNELTMFICEGLFLDYCILGGMPAVMREYIEKGTFESSLEIQRQLLADYQEDIRKYAGGMNQTRILNVFNQIPPQLAKDNKKFLCGQIETSAFIKAHCMRIW